MEYGSNKVLVKKSSKQNMQTGEIIVEEDSVILRTKKRERFMLLYVENFSAVVKLQRRTQEILAQILAKKVTYGTNEVVLDSVFRVELATLFKTSRQVITNSISELVEKKIFKREKRDGGYIYLLNPYLFGQGEWNSIEKQRQQFTIDYDFKNFTALKEVKNISAYSGLPATENLQIVKREQYIDNDGILKHDVYVEEKDLTAESEIIDTTSEEFSTQQIQTKEDDIDAKIDILLERTQKFLEDKKKKIKEKKQEIEELELEVTEQTDGIEDILIERARIDDLIKLKDLKSEALALEFKEDTLNEPKH